MKKAFWMRWAGVFLLSAAVMLLAASRTSPVYSLLLGDYGSNSASAAMVIGKGWAEGTVLPYRDLFAMGGPLYYLIQAIGWLIGGRTGIFILEIISFAVFLGLTAGTASRFAGGKLTAACLALCMVLYMALCAGGNSAFEWCLPFVAAGLFLVLRLGQAVRNRDMVLMGLLCGCVLLLDFRAGGLLYGAMFCMTFRFWREQKDGRWKGIAGCLVGVLIPVLIAVIGFAAAGDLRGMLQAAFIYPGRALLSGFDSLQMLIHKAVKCLLLFPLVLAGILWVKSEKGDRFRGICLLISALVCGMFLLCGDNRWYYYLAALPAVPVGIAMTAPVSRKNLRAAAVGFGFLLILGLSAVPLKAYLSFLLTGVPDVINEFYGDAQDYEAENPGFSYIAIDTDCSYFLLMDKMPDHRYFTDQTELTAYDPDVGEAVDAYLQEEPVDILFITERGYIGRELDRYSLRQVYLKYGGSLFVYLPNE